LIGYRVWRAYSKILSVHGVRLDIGDEDESDESRDKCKT